VWDRSSRSVMKTNHHSKLRSMCGVDVWHLTTTPGIPADHADGANRYRLAANFEHDSRASNDRSRRKGVIADHELGCSNPGGFWSLLQRLMRNPGAKLESARADASPISSRQTLARDG
jgi:hypothetical protein